MEDENENEYDERECECGKVFPSWEVPNWALSAEERALLEEHTLCSSCLQARKEKS
jgi:hypothetical protein